MQDKGKKTEKLGLNDAFISVLSCKIQLNSLFQPSLTSQVEPFCITCISSFTQPGYLGNGKIWGTLLSPLRSLVVYGGFYLKQFSWIPPFSMLPRVTYLHLHNSSHVNEGISKKTQKAVNSPPHTYFLSICFEK